MEIVMWGRVVPRACPKVPSDMSPSGHFPHTYIFFHTYLVFTCLHIIPMVTGDSLCGTNQ